MDELFRDFAQWLWKFLTVSAILLASVHLLARRLRARSKPTGSTKNPDPKEDP